MPYRVHFCRSIEYLFPSGLSDPLALPVMKPPEEIMPRFRRFTFDDEGRPASSLFYTIKSNFYKLLSASIHYNRCEMYTFPILCFYLLILFLALFYSVILSHTLFLM